MKCINEFLRTVIAEKLGAKVTEAEDKTAFFTLGVTSLISEEIMTILHKEFTGLSETLLFEYPNIEKLSEFLSAQKRNPESVLEFKETEPDTGSRQEEVLPVQAAEKVPVPGTDRSSDIAVIGMSGMFPKAENQHDFWDNLMENKDCVSEIPEDRWDSSYYSEEKTAEYASYSKWGGFIDRPDRFDPLFFSVSPWEADLMDPQQKLYVTCCWEAMEDAGYGNPAARPTDQIGVFAGVTWNEYSLIAHEEGFLKDQYKGPGSLYWGIPNRVSYFLDLHGPSIAVDTACSSSLVAVHQACQAIMSGDCEMALAGGVNLSLHPQKYMFLSQSHFLSSEGKCRSFGEGGDGYVPGEGAGAVLLKPLKKAIADNDHIYGVIKGSATNHGGKTTGYTVPNPEAHRDLILSAINRAAVSPADISYIEAHGTGTALGDPIEIRGLSMAFEKQADEKNDCGIGSVKSNIGHLEAAAGIAGLIKVLLSMKHETLPASLHAEELNRKISFSDSPFYVVRNNRPWPAEGDKPRIAAISSFGAGGSNAHLIVGAYQPKRQADGNTEQKPHAVVLSAHSEQQLKEYAGKLSSFLARLENLPSAGGYSMENIAATLLSGREPFSFRLAVIASSLSELKQRLDGFVSGHSGGRHIYFGKASPGRPDVSGQSVSDPEKFAALWVKGLQGFKKPETPYQKVPLPTYPFLKETSWLTDQKKRYTKKPQNTKRREALHPLLDENVSSARKGTFQKIFSKDEYFFKDHLVNEKYVLPGVCHLEMAAYGAALWGERPAVSLQNVWYMEPIVTGTDPRSVMIEFEAEKERISYVIKEKGAAGTLFSQGEVICKEKGAPFEAQVFQFPALFSQRTEPKDIYHSFSEAGIVQKDSFQVIREFSYTERKALAKLTLPSHLEADFKQYILHPSLMDGAVQTAMAHVLQFQKEPALIVPFSFGEIQLLKPLAKTVFVHAEVKAASVHQFDLHICDERGVLLAAVKDFIIKEVQESAGFNQKAGVTPKKSRETELLMTPVWNTVTIPETGMSFMREEKIIVIGGGPDFQQALKEMYSDVRFPDITSLDSAEQMAETLKAQGSFQHMIWAAPDHPIPSVYDADTADGQEHGVMQLFRLVKSLLLLNFDTEQLSLTICTFQAQPIHEHDEVNPSHASIHGLAGSLAKEYSNWSIRLLDLESQRGDRHLPDIFSLPADPEGNPWVLRAGQWHRQQLAVCRPHADEPSLYRHGGVYVIIGGAGGIGEVWTEYMIQTYQAKIVWIGRRKKDTQIERKLKRLAALGPAPQYLSADAADYDSLKRAYDTIVKEHGKVHGIIHSAIVLSDRSFANMEEEQFRASLSAKTDVSLQIARVAEGEPLDFLLFFSSMMSFQKAPGQSNYAAGCTFKDAFAKRISQKAPYAVKVVNWGFWGSVGVVASEQYRKRMERDGIASIEAPEAMKTLETLLSGPYDQLALIKTTDPVFMKDDLKEQVTVYPEKIPSALGQLAVNITQNDEAERVKASNVMSCMREMESLIEKILVSTLYEMGARLDETLPLFQSAAGITEQYSRWLKESFVFLTELALAPEKTDLGEVWEEWERKKVTWLRQKDMRAHVRLAEETLRVLPDILTGKLPATEVMFPDSSFRLVEGIYRNNIISDFFNDKLADTLIAVLRERLEKDPQAKIRILEIGAGTGGTSAAVMRKLKPYEAHIAEYCFTDISKAFLLHAEDVFGPEYPYVTYKIFNAEQPVSTEVPDIGTYDAVIATNVLHATKNIRSTLRHAKAMLQKNGQLFINEINSRTIFNHVTFGLLEGWWLYEDHDLRIPGCPGVEPAGWAEALSLEGFVHPLFPAEAAHDLGQQIIAAESDGTVRLALPQASEEKPERRPYDADGLSDDTLHFSLREKSVELMKKVIGEALKVPAHRLLSHEPLTAYGLDSILVVRLTNALKDVFGSVSSTLFFEYQTIDELADYFLSSRKEALERQFGNGRAHPENAGRMQAPAESAAPIPNVRERGITYLTELIGKTLKIPSGRMDPSVSLTAYGLDSILVVRLTNAFRNVFDQMTSTLFFEYQTIEEIADYLLLSQRGAFMKAMGVREEQLSDHTDNLNVKQNRIPQIEEGSRSNGDPYIQDIAVIGLSGRYPGADHVDELWENVKAGRHSITEVPKDRWDWKTFYNEERGKWGSIYSKWGGFLDDIDKFDPLFFRISPAEAERMDPQERLFLQTAYSSIEDAGYTPATLCDSRKIGVFVGVMNSNYPTVPSDWSIANRVSFLFNFQGPSMAVDTACSSSLTAVHLAAESLRSGMSETAIAGGVNLIVDPAHYERLSAFSMLSPGDKCKSFGDRADGFVDGEGVGAIVLKPLAQAEKDGDHIYGVIKGSMLNAAGRTNAYMVPNPKAQFDLIAETLKRTDIHPRTVSYLEAHGTGTALGDPIEIDGLTKAFRLTTEDLQFCSIGSIKSNIGHLESAAGIAGITKLLLQLKHKRIAPSLHAAELNPNIEFEHTPFFVQQKETEWKRPVLNITGEMKEYPRIAGISSFGAGGSNAHVIIQEYVPSDSLKPRENASVSPQKPAVIILSARNEQQLKERARQLLDDVIRKKRSDGDLAKIAYTLQAGREPMAERLAFTAESIEELKMKLMSSSNDHNIEHAHIWRGRTAKHHSLAASLTSDEDMALTINAWLKKEKYGKLLDLWVKGLDVDWSALYQRNPGRISLPAYPFAKDRYWVTKADVSLDKTGSAESEKAARLHPLLHANTSTFTAQRFTSVFSGREPFFADHIVNGKPVLPGAAALEMARAAVTLAAEDLPGGKAGVRLKQIVWLRPVTALSEGVTLHVKLQPEENGDIAFEAYAEGEEPLVFFQGKAVLEETERRAPVLDVEAVQARCGGRRMSKAECYEAFDSLGITYGPSHQALDAVYAGSGEVLAKLTLPPSACEEKEPFILHPSMLDAALQASIGLVLSDGSASGRPFLPFALRDMQVFSACRETMWAVLSSADGAYHIELCDENGEVCVRLTGLTARFLEEETEGKPLLLQPEWQESPPGEDGGQEEAFRYVTLYGGMNAEEISGAVCAADGEGPIEDRYDACAAELSAIVKRLIKEKQKKKTLIQLLVPDRGEDNVLAGLAAFLKTAHLEHPKLYGQVIQADPDESASALLAKLKENRAHPEQTEIRYEAGKRLVRNWRHLPPQRSTIPWKDEGVYLLTGGAGGIGLIFAEEIASRVKNAVLILTGRAEALNKDRSARLRRLEASGARVLYQPVDVTDRAAVIALVRGIQEEHGTLDGIIHGAGVIADNYILNQTENERKIVMAPKVKGLINLDEAAKDVRLDFFILFSSLAGGMGNPGQAGYAAANAFMDVYAARRNRLVRDNNRSGQTLSVNWPLWEEGGMRVDKETERLMYEQTGMKAMRSASGIQALYAAFASGEHQVMVAEGDEKRIRKNLMPEAPEPSRSIHVSRKTHVHLPNKVQAELKHMISGILKVKEEEIDAESEMRDYGFDSVSFTQFANELNKMYGLELTPAVFFEYPTVFSFAQYLLTEHPDTFGSQEEIETEKPVERKKMKTEPFSIPSRLPKTKTAAAPEEPVAIIGISCAFPMAENPEMFWENLAGEKDCISEIPPERWDWRQYYGDPQKDKNASNVKWGGFIDETAQFDPLFFGISPHEAEMMDPQQRLLMMHVWKAIEDAGCSAKSLSGTNTGIFAGTANSGYAQEASKFHIEIEGSSAAGTVPSIGPNRMSYFLNIHGPSEPIETACSSSLVAVHRAVRAIQAGDCGIAIAGGVNAIVSPDMHISFNKAGMLSEDGRCKTFSDQADGYVRAEGAGMIVLKTLSDAERDGDRIYAVIRGTAENHGGRAASLTSPNPKAQTEVMIKAYQQANIDPRTVSYIEAHGTGTALGDPIEINGLKAAFAALYQKAGVTAPDQPHCGLGSVKTNIGHTELAAGMAGLLKIILQMQHKTLVKSLHCETVNPYISLDGSPFYFVRDTQPWKAATDDSGNELPRRAGVSSFGFGGVNAHVVLEEYVSPVEEKQWTAGELQPSLFILSAKTAEQLKERAEQLRRYLEKSHSADGALADIAYTLQLGRDEMEERLAVIAETKEELTNALNDFLSGKETGQNFFTGRNKAMKQLFTEMTDNAEMSGAVDQWIEAGKYAMLAKLWVQGLHIDWSKLYPDERPKKVSLPVYPFAKTHCWIPHSAQHIRHRETYETDTSPLETYERLLDELEKNEISIEAAVKRTIGFYRD
ncbi:SDR family NAD(P)-dependent oxidoreductase [Bacillus amyloliquefaciens]|uniref:type I polyketide synthase n=1 Tax=Bacillus amyloliquefaciens group TaxID=1938374 RepID=UPI0014193E65|nr:MULTISPECIES: type I polyketide synthase [Bacillus amyloliquefaciens group]MBI0443638.1 SDR family NAD(P)-dependent oxidoreductase [Bacillus velezensis]NIH01273.1 SDR family NAD(P)-dependent oxidoreductase [Bacillus amyloliquefaciens]QUI66833.1 SDR family NAD(P)-dependent oxidoreductase [Bacillus velezensis]